MRIAKRKVANFKRRYGSQPCMLMEQAWTQPCTFICRRSCLSGPGWEVLVKWCHLGYDHATWEVTISTCIVVSVQPSCFLALLCGSAHILACLLPRLLTPFLPPACTQLRMLTDYLGVLDIRWSLVVPCLVCASCNHACRDLNKNMQSCHHLVYAVVTSLVAYGLSSANIDTAPVQYGEF